MFIDEAKMINEIQDHARPNISTEITLKQVEDNASSFYTELGNCPHCTSTDTVLDIDQESWQYNPRCLECGKSGGWFKHRRAAIASWRMLSQMMEVCETCKRPSTNRQCDACYQDSFDMTDVDAEEL